MSKILVAMSGGVDSSVAALLLHEQGHTVFGATMALWDFDAVGGNTWSEAACCSLSSIQDAQKVCWKLGVKHHVFNFREPFEKKVIHDFVEKYRNGKTPNPCVLCNAEIKWRLLLEKARVLECDYLATGHYAQVQKTAQGRIHLLKGTDRNKDQSYFLWAIQERLLAQTLFPLGCMAKPEVRGIAEKAKLPTSKKPESQEVCFVPDSDYGRFFRERAEKKGITFPAGDIVDTSGIVTGRHHGLPLYTVGQRRGIGHHGSRVKYVVAIDAAKNQIVIGDNADLFKKNFSVADLNWIGNTPAAGETMRCAIRIRYRQKEQPGTVAVKNGEAQVEYIEPQRAITPGQSAVFYEGERVLGGGIIANIENHKGE